MRFRAWEPRGALKCDDGKRLWAPREVTCDACGYPSRHFEAMTIDLGEDGESPRFLFGVPYLGMNHGIAREIPIPFEDDDFEWEDDQTVFLSECCEFPRSARR